MCDGSNSEQAKKPLSSVLKIVTTAAEMGQKAQAQGPVDSKPATKPVPLIVPVAWLPITPTL